MNLLFVNYGDFTTNSINHIAGFARALTAVGHTCVVAIAGEKSSLSFVPNPSFIPATYDEVLANPALFPDGRPADVVHAWTPREAVRRFVVAYKRKAPSRLVVHLEDNEEFLIESYMDRPFASLRGERESDFPKPLESALPHPVRYRNLLRLADGVTVIIDTLRDFVPAGIPVITLPPGIDFAFYRPLPPDPGLREDLGIRSNERVIVFTGSNTFANEAEIRDLYLAVKRLNERGERTRLIRTGFTSPEFPQTLPENWREWTIELGFIDKARLPGLLAISDVVVQPGYPGAFNDYRLPSKLPEYLASGRPVVTVASNLGLELTDGVNAVVLAQASPEAIADACSRLFADPATAAEIGRRGAEFARDHFDLESNSARLSAFYGELSVRPIAVAWHAFKDAADVTLLAKHLAAQLAGLPSASTPAWREIVNLADDLALLCRDLEITTEHADSILHAARSRLENERDDWKRGWTLTDQHAKNLESKCALLTQQTEMLDKTVTDLRDTLASLAENRDDLKHRCTLTDQHARNIEATLTATRNHAENLEKVLAALEADYKRSETQRTRTEIQLRSARQQNSAFEAELARNDLELARKESALASSHMALADSEHRRHQIESELARTQYQLAETRSRALVLGTSSKQEIDQLREYVRETIRQRDSLAAQRQDRIRKIETIQESFSWRITAPLRFLRRKLIDPYRKKPAEPPSNPASEFGHSTIPENRLEFSPADFVAPLRTFRFSVDYPQVWSFSATKVVVRGWCLTTEAAELKKIRARIGNRMYSGVYGLKRMDVLAALRDVPQAEYSGFKIDVTLQENDEEIVLEVADIYGVWHRFFSSPLKVGAHHGLLELTRYERWTATYDAHTPESLAALRAKGATFGNRPVISVIMPVYVRAADDEKWLVKAIESVRGQAYPLWELCIADDASPAPQVRPLLERYAREDARIKVVFREKNGHISAASNSAIGVATGEFIVLLDHDDELAPNALHELVALLNVRPETDYIYSDEDKIDEEGRRHEPYFKPDFLPDLFVGQNFTSHLSAYRRELVTKIGGFREGYEGSQDWDLTLRFIEQIRPERIRHIPKVLYHWRAIPGSTAMLLSEKNYPVEAARRALGDHFRRRGERVELIPVPGDHWRVKRPRPATPPFVSLVIPSRNAFKLLSRCVDTILEKTRYPNFEITIVDNGTDDSATLAYFEEIKSAKVRIIRYDAPFNYSAINNFGVRESQGEIVGLLNNDLEAINGDWLDEMVSHAVRPEIGCVGAMLYYPNETIQHAGVIVGLGGVAGHAYRDFPRGTEGQCNRARLVQNYTSVTAACLLVRRSVYEQVGGFDESLAVAFNDIDFCLKVRAAGYWNLWTPFSEFYHHESASRGAEDTPEKHERFRNEVEIMLKRWKDVIDHDPAYNPNLSLEHTDFSLAVPPRPWVP